MRAPPGLRVEPMRPDHLDAVVAIERRVQPRPWSPRLFAAELERPERRRYLVATARRRLRREVVGFGGVVDQAGDAHVTTVAVAPEHQGRGVGTALVSRLLAEAAAMGADAATLEVRASNRRAQLLYGRLGFAPVGVRPGYYPDDGEDAIVMWSEGLRSPARAGRRGAVRAGEGR